MKHYYVSTACQHDLHGRCRLVCKFCATPCECPCHKHEGGVTVADPGRVQGR